MMSDNITDYDIKLTLLNGEKKKNKRGPGYKYQFEVIVVIADSEPCHFYIVTTWKTNNQKPSYKNKPYRRRRYMRRKKKGKPCTRCNKARLEFGKYPLEISGNIYGEYGGYRCPNCGIVYFTEESSEKIKEILAGFKIKPLDPIDLVLILLYSTDRSIKGAVSFMKESFLLFKEKLWDFKVPALSPHFISYHYGPYSFDIVEAWYHLENLGFLDIEGRKSSNKETFTLTEKGKEEAKKIYNKLPKELRRELPRWRRGLDELGNDGILRDVYSKYDEYTDKSKIRNEVLLYYMHGRA